MVTTNQHRRTRRAASPTQGRSRVVLRRGRSLFEEVTQRIRKDSPLKIDRDKCIIYGVKVLGRYSKNTYDLDVEGTEYSPNAMRQALDLYEDADVFTDHVDDRKKPGSTRSVGEAFGKLRNVRMDGDCIRADLHYKPSHELAESVLDDIELKHGTFGLSHNAKAGKETVKNNRLIIEEITLVRSVDLVTKPATNRNLWESHMPQTTLRKLLSKVARKRGKIANIAFDLLEDDTMPMDEPVEDTPTDPDAALSDAFMQSCMAILGAIFGGEIDEATGMSKIKEVMKARSKLMTSPEVEEEEDEPDGDEMEEAEEEDEPSKKDKEEADDEDDSDKKKDKKESYRERSERLERELRAVRICNELKIDATDELLESMSGLDEKKARKLAEQFKGGDKRKEDTPVKPRPRSVSTGRTVTESKREKDSTNGTGKLAPWLMRLQG